MKKNENLLHYLKARAGDELENGFDLFEENWYDISVVEKKRTLYTFHIPSQSGHTSYDVKLNVLKEDVHDDCTCKAYVRFGQCKHCTAAALFLLQEEFGYEIADLEDLLNEENKFNGYTAKIITPEKEPKKAEPAKVLSLVPQPESEWKTFQLRENLKSTINGLSGQYWIYPDQVQKVEEAGFDKDNLHWRFYSGKKN